MVLHSVQILHGTAGVAVPRHKMWHVCITSLCALTLTTNHHYIQQFALTIFKAVKYYKLYCLETFLFIFFKTLAYISLSYVYLWRLVHLHCTFIALIRIACISISSFCFQIAFEELKHGVFEVSLADPE